jgi:tRNA(Ile2)-agmatinylcytidine synthase
MWIGVDDTDSPRGGCTTYVLTELIALAGAHGLDLLGEARLVRLNPNIPWRTRGNAALSAHVGHGRGPRRRSGVIGGRTVWSYARGGPPTPEERDRYLEAAWDAVRAAAQSSEEGTDPALVAVGHRLPVQLYWNAVRSVVPVADVRNILEHAHAWFRFSGSDRGLVGAAAAVAWAGAHPTWEAIAYRDRSAWGTPRTVDIESVRTAQSAYPRLFLCYDARTRRLLVAPHTPCPILFGLRATDRDSPRRALALVKSEPVDRWLTFTTNQGTGDHLVPRENGPWPELTSGVLRGTVHSTPSALPGGHVRFELATATASVVTCVAFEPTKTLPSVARELAWGDEVRIWGSRGADASIHLEGIEVLRWNPRRTRGGAPPCPTCRRRTESAGTGRGFRCRRCSVRLPPEAAVQVGRAPPRPAQVYHPTPSARRHLAPRGPEIEK